MQPNSLSSYTPMEGGNPIEHEPPSIEGKGEFNYALDLAIETKRWKMAFDFIENGCVPHSPKVLDSIMVEAFRQGRIKALRFLLGIEWNYENKEQHCSHFIKEVIIRFWNTLARFPMNIVENYLRTYTELINTILEFHYKSSKKVNFKFDDKAKFWKRFKTIIIKANEKYAEIFNQLDNNEPMEEDFDG